MENSNPILPWLMKGDATIQFQVKKDLLDKTDTKLQNRIEKEGWGLAYLEKQRPDGHWGMKFYQPKWTSSHYTLLDLRNLWIRPDHPAIRKSIQMIALAEKGKDGGINPSGSIGNSDVCINGMFMNYASYFQIDETLLHSVVDFILSQRMCDGGFNCRLNRSGARHSSMHTTICTLEGIAEYQINGYQYRLNELLEAQNTAREFLLIHHLFRSDQTGEVIHPNFLRMPYPYRWRYDFLRALDYFRHSDSPWDDRLTEGIELLIKKRTMDGHWKINAPYPGQVHIEMEKPGKPSRWNTLRALRVMKYFKAS